MSFEYREPQTPEEWNEAMVQQAARYSRERERLSDLISRIEPVCRNCVNAGAPTTTGNAAYGNGWASCRAGAPSGVSGRRAVEQYTYATTAEWPAVHHTQTCGRFVLIPLSSEQQRDVRQATDQWRVRWAFDAPLRSPEGPRDTDPLPQG